MESTEPDASAPMGLWEFARHIRTITVMGTTVRLVVPTDLTERGASDLMGLRSSAGHISCNNPRGSGENEPQRIIDSIVRVLAIRRPVSSGDFAQACGSDPDQAMGRLARPGIACRNSPRSYCRRSDEPHCRQRASAPVLISGIRRHAGAQLPPEVHSSGITNERVRKWP